MTDHQLPFLMLILFLTNLLLEGLLLVDFHDRIGVELILRHFWFVLCAGFWWV